MTHYKREMIQVGCMEVALHCSAEIGPPVFIQHGLLGNMKQPAAIFPHGCGFSHWVMECRGHGCSTPSNGSQISIEVFADDLAIAIAKASDRPVIAGGISMGAVVALRLAIKRPDLIKGLMLARPAWFLNSAPDNMLPNAEVGDLLEKYGPEKARKIFQDGSTAKLLMQEAPDCLRSLLGFFDRKPVMETAYLLQKISADGPKVDASALQKLECPVIVLASDEDLIHPISHAKSLVASIPRSSFYKLTPKGRDLDAHQLELRGQLLSFLEKTKND